MDIVNIIQTITLLFVSIVIVIMLIQAIRLKEAYKLGKEFEAQCFGEYLEKERAEHIAHTLYINEIEKSFEPLFTILAVYFSLIILGILVILFYLTFFKEPTNLFLIWMYIVGTLLLIVFLLVSLKEKNVKLASLSSLIIPLILLILKNDKLPGVLNLITNFIYNNYYLKLFAHFIILSPLLVLLVLIFLVWLDSYVPIKIMKDFKYVSPFDIMSRIEISPEVQPIHIVIIFIIVLLLWWFTKDRTDIIKPVITSLFIPLIAILIVIPIITSYITPFNIIKTKYIEDTTDINQQITTEITTNANNDLKNSIIKNIISYEASQGKEFKLPELGSYSNNYYEYLKHSENNVDLQKIVIPESLKRYLNPDSLQDENILKLKFDIYDFYKAGTKYNLDEDDTDLREQYHINTSGGDNALINFKNNLDRRAKYKIGNILVSLIDILLKTSNLSDEELKIKKNFLETLNNTIIGNIHLGTIDMVLPRTIKNKLFELREDKEMKEKIDGFYSIARLLCFFILFIILYIVYKQFMNNNPEAGMKYLALAIIVLLIILIALGFLIKETWM